MNGPPPDSFPARENSSPPQGRRFPRRGLGWALFLTASAGLGQWGRGAAPFVAWELARDHRRCFALARLPATIWTSDPHEVTAWFEAQGTRFPVIPSGAGDLTLVGARYCPLLDRVSAHLYYAGANRHLSLYVLAGPVRFDSSFEVLTGGRIVHLLHTAGTTVAIVGERAEDVEAVVSTFMTSVAEATEPGPAHGGY